MTEKSVFGRTERYREIEKRQEVGGKGRKRRRKERRGQEKRKK